MKLRLTMKQNARMRSSASSLTTSNKAFSRPWGEHCVTRLSQSHVVFVGIYHRKLLEVTVRTYLFA